ncbi:MAG: alpha/beta hydrolase [Halieaceae bacterium]|jgi:pimeloyl-ACP methyl ester carboxylesterase|nr:alpha/beta hydrolase [Halieaceae bacterium]
MREVSFHINGRRLQALVWGEPGAVPVLALHGWLDNAASFIPLGERLQGVQLVALDMAGHGHSDHRTADGEYAIWSDLPDIEAVVDQLGWERFVLLGHSRGAIISTLYASSRPDRVCRLALLDGLQPPLVDAAETPQQLASFLDDRKRLLDKPGREFTSVEEALALRQRFGLGGESVRAIVERNLKPSPLGWQWRFDPRLQGASSFKLTEAHSRAVLTGLSMPGLLLLADQGLGRVATLPDVPATVKTVRVPGGHHCHIAESLDEVSQYLNPFILEEADSP